MLLLKNKCNINISDIRGSTPLFEAARCHKMSTCRELAWSLCDLKIRDKEGKTAADVARDSMLADPPGHPEDDWWTQDGHHSLAEYLANEAPLEQVCFASHARVTP